jgi:hypothetical protein
MKSSFFKMKEEAEGLSWWGLCFAEKNWCSFKDVLPDSPRKNWGVCRAERYKSRLLDYPCALMKVEGILITAETVEI